MSRYFFHLTNGETLADEVGEEFDLVEAARGHALGVARELSRNGLPSACIGRYIAVMDEWGVAVYKVPL
jgi:hypothetical protein